MERSAGAVASVTEYDNAELVGGPMCGTTLNPKRDQLVCGTTPVGFYQRTGKVFSDGSVEFRWELRDISHFTQADGVSG